MKKRVSIFVFFVLVFISMWSAPLFAERDDGDDDYIIDIYHDYFIPWVAGADNCYGAYRIAVADNTAWRNVFEGSLDKNYSGGWNYKTEKPEPLSYSTDIRGVTRDDLVIATDFALGAYREELLGNELHHHTYHYETPYLFAGKSVIMNPVHGVVEGNTGEGVSRIALTRRLAYEYFKDNISPEGFTLLLVPGFGGANPKGTILKKVTASPHHYKYILSLSPDLPEVVGWWRMLSVEALTFINQVRSTPGDYIRTPSAAELAAIEAAKKAAWSEESAKNPSAGKASFDAGYDWSIPRIFYSPEMFGMFRRQKLDRASSPAHLYSYRSEFLNPFDMHNLWNTEGDKVAAGLFDNVPNPETVTVKLNMGAVSGWRIGKNAGENRTVSVERVVSPPQAILVSPPFSEGKDLDSFRALHPGTWGASGGGSRGINITTYSPDALARWPFGYAQGELFRLNLSSRDRLSEKAVREQDIPSVINQKGGILAFSTGAAGWKIPGINVDGSSGSGVPVDKDIFAASEPVVVAPGSKPSGASPWEAWAKRDRKFYDSVIPYFSGSIGLLFWDEFDFKELYPDRAIERQYRPEVIWAANEKTSRSFSTGASAAAAALGLQNSRLSRMKEYEGMYQDTKKGISRAVADNERAVSGKDKDAWEIIAGTVVKSGTEHLSRLVKSTIQYVPMRPDKLLPSLQAVDFLRDALDSKIISLPGEVPLLKECRVYFPLEGVPSVLSHWPSGK